MCKGKQPLQPHHDTADSSSGRQLIARASPAMQNAEREILNLRLCSAHPFIIHMHEVALTASASESSHVEVFVP